VLQLDARYAQTPALLAGAAAVSAGVAAAAVARRAGWAEPGELVSLSLGGLLIGAALVRPAIQDVTPYDPRLAAAIWWTLMSGIAAVTLAAGTRDPLARRPATRPDRPDPTGSASVGEPLRPPAGAARPARGAAHPVVAGHQARVIRSPPAGARTAPHPNPSYVGRSSWDLRRRSLRCAA
jgi:hypothetical protein